MDDPRSVVITGLGPVTSIGVGNDALWSSLADGNTNVVRRELPVDVGECIAITIAAMPDHSSVAGLDKHLAFLTAQECEGHRDLAYSLLAVELALTDAGLRYDRDQNNIGVVQAFEAPGVERTVSRLYELLNTAPPTPQGPPRIYDLLAPHFYMMQPFLYVHLLGKAFGCHGYSTSVHNACSSGAFAIETAAQQIRSGQADVMVVAGGEAFDTGVRLEWFRRLGLYAADTEMIPFGTGSSGFYVGEGAAAIVLESADHAADRGAKVIARYSGGAFSHQAWKQTIPDVRSQRLGYVIVRALELAGVAPSELNLVVPHGAATSISDKYEAAALDQSLQGNATRAVATAFKPSVGHMLAASGLIDLLCGLLAMRHQVVPGVVHGQYETIPFPVPLLGERSARPVKSLLKLFTGFTGHDAALVFQCP